MGSSAKNFLGGRTCGEYAYDCVKYDHYIAANIDPREVDLIPDGTSLDEAKVFLASLDADLKASLLSSTDPVEERIPSAHTMIFGLPKGVQFDIDAVTNGREKYERILETDPKYKKCFFTEDPGLTYYDHRVATLKQGSVRDSDISKIFARERGIQTIEATLRDYSLLINLLDLFEVQLGHDYNDGHMGALLAVCEDHGLPFYASRTDTSYKNLPHRIWQYMTMNHLDYPLQNSLYQGFHFLEFWLRLKKLYIVYLGWRRVFYDDSEASRMMEKLYFTTNKHTSLPPTHAWAKEVIIECSPKVVSTKSLKLSNKGEIITQTHCGTLFAALQQQMIDIISMGTDFIEGRSIYYCKECGHVFVQSRRNNTLCEDCRKNDVKVRRFRARKEEEERMKQNAQQAPTE